MKSKFTTTAPATKDLKWDAGYGAGAIDPRKLADEVFHTTIPGSWLCCYMLRRFGWPNEGSDPYKNLMSWSLTTPLAGLYLSVTPYLGADGREKFSRKFSSNLHFGIRFTKKIGDRISHDPVREAHFAKGERIIMRWWKTKGIKLYAFGCGLKSGDPDELVHHFADDNKKPDYCWGLWRRTPTMNYKGDIPKQAQMVEWWLWQFVKKNHPEIKEPKFPKQQYLKGHRNGSTAFKRKVCAALRATLLDLLRPTNVRDISFTPFGDIERTPAAIKHYKDQESAGYFTGAGNTPEYYYSKAGKQERRKPSTLN